jgi:hypothetical protein
MNALEQLDLLCTALGVPKAPPPKSYSPTPDIHCYCPCDFRALPVKPHSVDAVVTDVPWDGDWLRTASDFAAWCAEVLRPGGIMATWCGKLHTDKLVSALSEHLRWEWPLCAPMYGTVRSNGSFFGSCWQLGLVFTSPGPPLRLHHAVNDWCPGSRREKDLYRYQCSLPQVQYLVEAFSRPEDLVVDPFSGSWATALACANTGRKFTGSDINPACLNLARHRFRDLLDCDDGQHP